MAISLVGKIVILVVVLAVVGGLTATIVLLVNENEEVDVTTTPDPNGATTDYPGLDETQIGVGVGIADMTGPCTEITFMGYAELGQSGEGIHLRQFSRAFIFVKGESRVVLVSAEVQAVGIAVRREVVKNLQDLYGDMYSLRNVILTGTHTHSAPGGHLVDFLLDISILGFSRESYNAYVDGITRSIVRAHENIVPARLFFGQTTVINAHMNRSPYSYEFNPPEERARYETDTDDVLTQLRIVKMDGNLHGVLNWFSIHTTSMNMTNKLISSDNLGYAALRLEKTLNPDSPTGKPDIVAGFFASNLGDISPNIRGARCEFSGEECDNQFLLCEAQERCYSLGPGDNMFESTRIIGEAVYEGALEVLNSPGEELTGNIAVVHQFVEMSEEVVSKYDPVTRTFDSIGRQAEGPLGGWWLPSPITQATLQMFQNQPVSGCVPAMGYSFASGTIDGANSLNITQGTIVGNPLLDSISGFIIAEPTPEDVECHAPKPILLATGRANFPFAWHPHVVSISLLWLGDLVVAGVPGEPTTMSGRRIMDVVGNVMESHGIEPRVVVSGLTNEYIHYVATFEEYQVQRYEAASTIYGPNTLDIFLNKFAEFTTIAYEGGNVVPGPEPEDNRNRTLTLNLPVLFDASPIGRSFGEVYDQPPSEAVRGETVSVVFVGASPRNDLRQEGTHLAVERLQSGQWEVVATDSDWDTVFRWVRQSTLTGTSRAIVEWTIPEDAISGTYRLVYYGASRSILGTITQFQGISDTITVE